MNVWMQAQVLTPGVQHANGSALNSIVTVAKCLQHAPDTLEHGTIESFAVEQAHLIQRLRNGKHHMKVFHILSHHSCGLQPKVSVYLPGI